MKPLFETKWKTLNALLMSSEGGAMLYFMFLLIEIQQHGRVTIAEPSTLILMTEIVMLGLFGFHLFLMSLLTLRKRR